MSFAFEGISSEVVHDVAVGLLVDFPEVVDEVAVPVAEVAEEEGVSPDESEPSGPTTGEEEVSLGELPLSVAPSTAAAEFPDPLTSMMFFAIRAPTTAPAIASIAMAPAIQYPVARQTFCIHLKGSKRLTNWPDSSLLLLRNSSIFAGGQVALVQPLRAPPRV